MALYTLVERLDKYAVRFHKLSIDSEGTGMGLKLYCKTPFYKDHSQERSLKLRMRVLWPIHSRVRFAVQSLDETLASEPSMFLHSKTSQESQVVMKRILTDSVLSLHHFAFKTSKQGGEKNLVQKCRTRAFRDYKW